MGIDSVEFDEFGRVYIRPVHYGLAVAYAGTGVAPKVNLEVRLCVICEKKLSIYNTDKNSVCYSDKCKKDFDENKKNNKKK